MIGRTTSPPKLGGKSNSDLSDSSFSGRDERYQQVVRQQSMSDDRRLQYEAQERQLEIAQQDARYSVIILSYLFSP